MLNIFYVYTHHRLADGSVFYVGKGSGARAQQTKARNRHWHHIVNKDGGFSVEFVVENVDEESAFLIEIDKISQLRGEGVALVNMTNGGEGLSGYVASEETRAKISAAMSGRQLSKDHIENVRKALLGRVVSAETRAKQSKSFTGRKLTDEHKMKVSKAHTGMKRSEEAKAKLSASRLATPKIKCPHCDKAGDPGPMKCWHFDNCKVVKKRKPKGPLSQDYKDKISKSKIGKLKSEETKARMSAAQKESWRKRKNDSNTTKD